MIGARRAVLLGGGALTPLQRILSTNPVCCIPITDTSGAVATDVSGNGHHGAYVNDGVDNVATWTPFAAGPGGGILVPYWDGNGATDRSINLVGGTFATCADWDEATYMIYCKVADVGVWSDGEKHDPYTLETATPDRQRVQVLSGYIQNRFWFNNSAADYNTHTTTTTDWFQYLTRVSRSANTLEFFFNNVQVGATRTVPDVWSTNTLNLAMIGWRASAEHWKGYLAYFTVWNRVISEADRNKVFF